MRHEARTEPSRDVGGPLSNSTILSDQEIEIDGLRIQGSPNGLCTVEASGGAAKPIANQVYSAIPDDTDIRITHGHLWAFGWRLGMRIFAVRRAVIWVRPRGEDRHH